MVKKKMKQMNKQNMACSMRCGCMHIGFCMLILGALILANVYWQLIGWPAFVGGVLVIAGFLKIIMHKKCM